ncbi:MAG: hypothetical protein ACI87N_003386 [Flavobacteriales bacterium]|jgi:hypothetical protein
MKPRLLFIFLLVFLLNSCTPKIYWTSSGGVRFVNPSTYWFKYKRNKFNNEQRLKIDTKSIYKTTIYGHDDSQYDMLARFFPNGQVLFFVEDQSTGLFKNQVNDSLAGIPGYYAIDGQKIKFQKWTNIFGDQTPKKEGIVVTDSMLVMFDSAWKITNKYKLTPYEPGW